MATRNSIGLHALTENLINVQISNEKPLRHEQHLESLNRR